MPKATKRAGGRKLKVFNVGSNDIVIKEDDGNYGPANRFELNDSQTNIVGSNADRNSRYICPDINKPCVSPVCDISRSGDCLTLKIKQIRDDEQQSRQATYKVGKDAFIEALKEHWIRSFGKMNDDNERNGYFMVGFCSDVFDEYFKLNKHG